MMIIADQICRHTPKDKRAHMYNTHTHTQTRAPQARTRTQTRAHTHRRAHRKKNKRWSTGIELLLIICWLGGLGGRRPSKCPLASGGGAEVMKLNMLGLCVVGEEGVKVVGAAVVGALPPAVFAALSAVFVFVCECV